MKDNYMRIKYAMKAMSLLPLQPYSILYIDHCLVTADVTINFQDRLTVIQALTRPIACMHFRQRQYTDLNTKFLLVRLVSLKIPLCARRL